MQCTMDHIVLNVEDDEKMMDFYSKVLMLEAERLQEYRAGMVPFPSVRLNSDTIIDLFPKRMWQKSSTTGQGRSNLNHFCLSLSKETWEDLVNRLKANNGNQSQGGQSQAADLIHSRSGCCSLNEAFIAFTST